MIYEEGSISDQHNREQLEAKAAELGVTILPPDLDISSPAFPKIIAAAILLGKPLDQEQIREIMERNQ